MVAAAEAQEDLSSVEASIGDLILISEVSEGMSRMKKTSKIGPSLVTGEKIVEMEEEGWFPKG